MGAHFAMVAKTLYGLEDVLADELTAIGAGDVRIGRRMVSFTGDKMMLYKANFCCRTALRILKPLSEFKADHADTVYREVKKIEWEQYLSPERTFAVDAVVYSENFNHSKFVAYRTKDAIADYFQEKYEKRPSVRVNNPDIHIHIHISRNDCTVSLDSSGESLHKRGYRVTQVDAPLNEVLAAGMILKTGWRGESHFVDPMCGSGTLLIEAAMIALNMAPGIFRKEYAFERWPDFDGDLLDEIYNDDSTERAFVFKCQGSDISPIAIGKADQNIRSAGLSKYIELQTKPFQQYDEAPQPGILVMNPPYGERISAHDIFELYEMIGGRLKHIFPGYNAWILSYKDECFERIGLRPKRRMTLMNGELECEYRCYELFEGKNKEYKQSLHAGADRSPRDYRPHGQRDNESSDWKNKSFRNDGASLGRESRPDKKKSHSFDRKGKPSRKDRRSFENKDKPFKKEIRSFGRDGKSVKKGKPYDRNRKSFQSGEHGID
jgi:putative N6-adenine-specific DNA methylase